MSRYFLLIIAIFFFPYVREVKAGLNKYTYLDQINGWIIERKVVLKGNKVFCRASIPDSGSWFSARTRLGDQDQLILKDNFSNEMLISQNTIDLVRTALRLCRNGFTYIPDT